MQNSRLDLTSHFICVPRENETCYRAPFIQVLLPYGLQDKVLFTLSMHGCTVSTSMRTIAQGGEGGEDRHVWVEGREMKGQVYEGGVLHSLVHKDTDTKQTKKKR